MATCPILTSLASVVLIIGRGGCVSPGVAMVPVVMLATPLALGIAVSADRQISERREPMNLERELRSLLPGPAEKGPARAPADQPGRLSERPVRITLTRDNRDHTGVSRDVLSVHAVFTGEISPALAQRLLEGVHQIAWRRANHLSLRIYGPKDLAQNKPQDFFSALDDFLFTPRGYPPLVERVLYPYRAVSKQLDHLISTQAALSTDPWGNRLPAGWRLDQGPRILAWGDFSPASAQTIIDASKAAFPKVAVTVWRDEGREPQHRKVLATYSPPPVRASPDRQ